MARHKEKPPALVKAPTPYTHAGAKKRGRPASKAKASPTVKPVPPASEWPAAEVRLLDLDQIKPHPENPNTHPDDQIDALAVSWREYGQPRTILVNENLVTICGHGTIEAAKRAGVAQVYAAIARGWPEWKQRAFMVADNALGARSKVDELKLRGLVADLSTIKAADMTAIGLSARKVAAILRPKVRKSREQSATAGAAAIEAATESVVLPFAILSTELILAIVEAATAAGGEEAAHVGEACALELKRRDRETRDAA